MKRGQLLRRLAAVQPVGDLLLDDFPGASAAFSLRKLRSAYTGAAIRVRRDSDDAEQDIGFDINGNLDTSALLGFVGSNDGFVVKWYDQSENDYFFEQSVKENQPTIVSSGDIEVENSNFVINFKLSQILDRRIENTQIVNSNNGHYTNFLIANSYGSGTNNGWYYFTQQSANSVGRFIETPLSINSIRNVRFRVAGTANAFISTKSFTEAQQQFIACGVCGDGFLNIKVNDGDVESISTNNDYRLTGTGDGFIGGLNLNNNQSHKVKIAEIIFYPEDKTSVKNSITQNINTYYDVF